METKNTFKSDGQTQLGIRMEGETLKEFQQMIEENQSQGFDYDIVSMRHGDGVYGLNVMCALIQKLKGDSLDVLEIGSYRGESSVIFHGWFKSVDCVDPYGKKNEVAGIDDMVETNASEDDWRDLEVKEHRTLMVAKFLMENNVVPFHDGMNLFHQTSDDFFETNKKKYDLIYVDGDHRYSQQIRDYTNAMGCLKENGILAGHDWTWESTQKVLADLGFKNKPMMHFIDDSFCIVPESLL